MRNLYQTGNTTADAAAKASETTVEHRVLGYHLGIKYPDLDTTGK